MRDLKQRVWRDIMLKRLLNFVIFFFYTDTLSVVDMSSLYPRPILIYAYASISLLRGFNLYLALLPLLLLVIKKLKLFEMQKYFESLKESNPRP